MSEVPNKIWGELKAIRKGLDYIKSSMADKEMFLSSKEKKALDDSFKHQAKGELVSEEGMMKELDL